MISSTSHRQHPQGFTLVELMIAVTILMVLAILAFPTLRGGLAKQHMKLATDEVMHLLDFARIQAIARNRAYVVTVERTFGNNGRITVDESVNTQCSGTADKDAAKGVRSMNFNSGEFKDIRITHVLPTELDGAFALCFRPDGRVVDSVDSKPIKSSDPNYGAGEARIVLRRLGRNSELEDVPHQVIVPYNGIPRFEPGNPPGVGGGA